jgi:MPBQ/MSBQ methyltransferase
MRQLLEQWAHPDFASIRSLRAHLQRSAWAGGMEIFSDDWSAATLPSWIDSIQEGLRRPWALLGLGPKAVLQGLRETPTILLMHWAFASGLMQFGVFRGRKPTSHGKVKAREASDTAGEQAREYPANKPINKSN